MKKLGFALISTLFIAGGLVAQEPPKMMPQENMQKQMQKKMHMPKNYRAVPLQKAQILQDGKAKMFCPKCGMTLPMFYRTNHAAKVDGKMEQFCSLHCLVEEMNSGKKVEDIQVVDNSSLKFIPAKDAWYVVGSSKPATMSKVSKYAFAKESDAKAFAKEFGGKVMKFDEVLKLAKESFKKEKMMISKKQAMMAKKGREIYEKMCQKIDKKFASAAEAKAYIKANNLCKGLKGKPLQAVGLFLSRPTK
jgi:nitrous oxide reductase accessory protein NosL